MSSLRIILPKGRTPPMDFDILGRRLAEVLDDLLPGFEIVLEYKVTDSFERSVKSPLADPDCGLSVTGFVGSQRDWFRKLQIKITKQTRAFLSEGFNDGSDRADTNDRSKIERLSASQLRAPLIVGTELISRWERRIRTEPLSPEVSPDHGSSFLDRHSLFEIKSSVGTLLPLWLIAHLTANRYYLFPTRSNEGNDQTKSHAALTNTIVNTISHLETLARTRVEHHDLSHGLVITPSPITKDMAPAGRYPGDFTLKRIPLLADGVRAALQISSIGECVGLITPELLQQRSVLSANPYGPLGLLAAASECLSGIALGLRSDRSIVIFANGQPIFVQRGGSWKGPIWSLVRDCLTKKFSAIGKVILDAAIMLSISGHGGLLGIVDSMPKWVHKKDRIDIPRKNLPAFGSINDIHKEWRFHALLPSDDVQSIGAPFLAMLAAIDGATIVDKRGKLLAYGAIVPSRSSGSEGARSAAGRELSKNGFTIKVSSDGPITLYEHGRQVFEA